jgi:hypothetical protein
MTEPEMMNYVIRADTQDLRDRILAWAETNIIADWAMVLRTWTPDDDMYEKWGLFIDGGTVDTMGKLLAHFRGEPFSIEESSDSWVTSEDEAFFGDA